MEITLLHVAGNSLFNIHENIVISRKEKNSFKQNKKKIQWESVQPGNENPESCVTCMWTKVLMEIMMVAQEEVNDIVILSQDGGTCRSGRRRWLTWAEGEKHKSFFLFKFKSLILSCHLHRESFSVLLNLMVRTLNVGIQFNLCSTYLHCIYTHVKDVYLEHYLEPWTLSR